MIGLYTAFNLSTNLLHDFLKVLHVNTFEFLLMIKRCKNDKSRFVYIHFLLVIIHLLVIYLSCRVYLFVLGVFCVMDFRNVVFIFKATIILYMYDEIRVKFNAYTYIMTKLTVHVYLKLQGTGLTGSKITDRFLPHFSAKADTKSGPKPDNGVCSGVRLCVVCTV